MQTYETSEQQPRQRSFAWVIVLIFILILVGSVGFLYYSIVKAPLETDNPEKLAAAAPTSAEERFRFSADGTAQIRIDKADLWNLIVTHAGKDFLELINEELSPYSLTVSGCAIHMDEEGLRLDMELYYKETRLVVKVPCALEISGRHLSLSPTGVTLGVIPLPVGGLLSSVKLEYDIDFPVISQVTGLHFEEGAAVITGSMEEDLRTLMPVDKKLYQTAVFCAAQQPLADALWTGEGFTAIMTHLEKNPGSVETLYRGLFIMADQAVTQAYLESRHGLTQRFFPGIEFSAVEAEQTSLNEGRTTLVGSLELLFTTLTNDYNEKQFRLSDGVFLRGGKPFHAAEVAPGEYDALFEVLDPESFFLILVDAEDGFIRKTSSFYRMADENQQFTQPVDFNKTYILGCVFRGVDGDAWLMYEAEIHEGNTYVRSIKLLPLTEEAVSALQVPGTFGVWTD